MHLRTVMHRVRHSSYYEHFTSIGRWQPSVAYCVEGKHCKLFLTWTCLPHPYTSPHSQHQRRKHTFKSTINFGLTECGTAFHPLTLQELWSHSHVLYVLFFNHTKKLKSFSVTWPLCRPGTCRERKQTSDCLDLSFVQLSHSSLTSSLKPWRSILI